MVLETLKGIADEMTDETKKETLLECHRLLQRPLYKLILHPYYAGPPKKRARQEKEQLLTETLVTQPRQIPLMPIDDPNVKLEDPRL